MFWSSIFIIWPGNFFGSCLLNSCDNFTGASKFMFKCSFHKLSDRFSMLSFIKSDALLIKQFIVPKNFFEFLIILFKLFWLLRLLLINAHLDPLSSINNFMLHLKCLQWRNKRRIRGISESWRTLCFFVSHRLD